MQRESDQSGEERERRLSNIHDNSAFPVHASVNISAPPPHVYCFHSTVDRNFDFIWYKVMRQGGRAVDGTSLRRAIGKAAGLDGLAYRRRRDSRRVAPMATSAHWSDRADSRAASSNGREQRPGRHQGDWIHCKYRRYFAKPRYSRETAACRINVAFYTGCFGCLETSKLSRGCRAGKSSRASCCKILVHNVSPSRYLSLKLKSEKHFSQVIFISLCKFE